MIITGGENVYSAEVESVIRELGAVADVAVIGLQDDNWGERVHAVVVTRSGESLGAEAILAHCRGRLVASAPMTPYAAISSLLKTIEARQPHGVA